MNRSWLSLAWRVVAFVGIPVWLALGFVEVSAARRETQDVAVRRDEMRGVLNRVATKAHPRKRFEDLVTRLAQCSWSIRSLCYRAARMVRSEDGALECLVFDVAGHLQHLPGQPRQKRAAAERFLSAMLHPDSRVPPSLIAAFAGTPAAARMLAQSPGMLVDLLNGDRRTYAGWWRVTDRHRRTVAHVIAFVHRSAFNRDALVDRAVVETRRLVGNLMLLGWQNPAEDGSMRPAQSPWPTDLRQQLAAMPFAVTEGGDAAGGLVRHCTENGELLFAVDRWPALMRSTPETTPSWLLAVSFVLAGLAFIALSGEILPPIFGLKGKLAWLFIAGGGLPLALLSVTATIDRANRETVLIETMQREHLEQMLKLDQAYYNHLYAYQRLYERVGRFVGRHPESAWANLLRLWFARAIDHAHGQIQSLVAVGSHHRLLCQSSGTAEKTAASLAFTRDMAHGALSAVRGDHRTFDPPTDGAGKLSELLAGRVRVGGSGRDRITFLNFPNQPLICFSGTIGPAGRPEALVTAIHGALRMQSLFMRRISQCWPRHTNAPWLFAAIPNTGRPELQPVPRADTGTNLQLRQLQHLVLTSRHAEHQRLTLGRCEYLISAVRGRYLDGYVMFVARPFAQIERETGRLHRQVSMLALVATLFGLILARVASSQLMDPIGHLGTGLAALSRRDFAHRVALENSVIAEFARIGHRFDELMGDVQDLQIARTIQTHLWPAHPLSGGDWELGGRCDTATHLGGDYYDWMPLADGRLVICLGDVAGHGIASALITAAAKIELAFGVSRATTPLAIVESMNRGLGRQAGSIRPMSLWLGIFDPGPRHLTFAVAGHPYAVVGGPGEQPRLIGVQGYPLASRRHATFSESAVDLAHAGFVLLYSDGLPETLNPAGEQFGYDRLMSIASELGATTATPTVKLAELHQRIRAWSGRNVIDDDMTSLWLELRPRTGARRTDAPCGPPAPGLPQEGRVGVPHGGGDSPTRRSSGGPPR